MKKLITLFLLLSTAVLAGTNRWMLVAVPNGTTMPPLTSPDVVQWTNTPSSMLTMIGASNITTWADSSGLTQYVGFVSAYSIPDPNYTISYMGYPKLALNTNMVSSSLSGVTGINLWSFTSAFDNNFSSTTTTGSANSQMHTYIINLVTNYTGVMVISMGMTYGNGVVNNYVLGYGGQDVTAALGVLIGGTYGYSSKMPDIYDVATGTRTNVIVKNFCGSKVWLTLNVGAAAGTYWIRDWSIYGVTNGFNSYTGVPGQ